jgi:hypothetical protein
MTDYAWNLRAEILESAHRWPIIMLFILVGSLTGALFAYLLPTPYQAEAGLQVTYNADVHPRNPDDFKNWQMEQLDILIHSDEVLQAMLLRLRAQDSSWDATSLDDLRASVHTYWRNAGEWRLVAEATTPTQAEELVETWEQIVLLQLDQALTQARTAFSLSTRIGAISANLANLKMDNARLVQIQQALTSWKKSAMTNNSSQPLSALDRWLLISRVAQVSGWDPAGLALFDETPPLEAAVADYIPWIDKTLVLIAEKLEVMEAQSSQLQVEYDQLAVGHAVALDASRGLTAYLAAESLDQGDRPAERVRPVGLMIFVGGLLGLLAWLMLFIARPLMRKRPIPV